MARISKKKELKKQINSICTEIDKLKNIYVDDYGSEGSYPNFPAWFTVSDYEKSLESHKKKLELYKKEGFPKCTEKQIKCIINFSEKKEFEEDFEEISKSDIENLNKFQASQLISNLIATNDNIYDYECPLSVFEQQEDELQNVMTTVFKK